MVGETGLNLLINNAGVSPRSTRINLVKAEQMAETFAVNTISPLMLTKAFLPLLKAAASAAPEDDFSIQNAAVINQVKILLVRLRQIGDVVFTTPAIAATS